MTIDDPEYQRVVGLGGMKGDLVFVSVYQCDFEFRPRVKVEQTFRGKQTTWQTFVCYIYIQGHVNRKKFELSGI